MKRVPPSLLAVCAAFASASLPAAAQLPPAPGQPIGVATVMGKSESDNGLSVTLDVGRSTLTRSGQFTPAAAKAFRQLQVGRAYVFPDAFHLPADDSAEFTQVPLLGLESRTPFRALVDRVDAFADRVSLRLCCADGSKIEYLHVDAQGLDQARALVANLLPEETYEFPAVLQGRQPPPAPAGAEPLDQYVGEWRGTLDGDPGFFIIMRCAWRADGKGLWREIMYDDSTNADPVYDVAIMTAETGGKFLASDPRDPNKLPATSSYDAATRTFTTRLPAFQAGVIRSNTATFTDPDTITWNTLSRSEAGAVLASTSGSYRRLKQKRALAGAPHLLPQAPVMAAAPPPTELLRLRGLPPFRATVLKRQITADSIRLELRIADCEPVVVAHAGKDGWDQALQAAQRLQEGRTYEFPDVLADAYVPPAAGAAPAPATDAMRALQPFIGSWTEPGHPFKDNVTRYFWKEDGTGLWQESTVRPPSATVETSLSGGLGKVETGPVAARVTPTLTTYDSGRQCYVTAHSVSLITSASVQNGVTAITHAISTDKPPAPDQEGRWDAATQTYRWSSVMDIPQPGTRYSGTRRLVTPDRMEWTSRVTAPDGRVIQEDAGLYERTAP